MEVMTPIPTTKLNSSFITDDREGIVKGWGGEKERYCAVYKLNGTVKGREAVLFRRNHGCG